MNHKLTQLFLKGLDRVDPHKRMLDICSVSENVLHIDTRYIDLTQFGKIHLYGAGKAAISMAEGLLKVPDLKIESGVIIGPIRQGYQSGPIQILPGDHPIPGPNSIASTKILLESIRSISPGNLVLFLISGGASAMLCEPDPGISLNELQDINKKLIHSGKSIYEINAIRKEYSTIKGGKLLNQIPSEHIVNLIISDVPGDDLSIIGSGPTIPDPDLPIAKKITNILVSSPALLSQSIETLAIQRQIAPKVIVAHSHYEGSYSNIATRMASDIRSATDTTLFIYYGESEVSVTGTGKGGRNQHLALYFALKYFPELEHDYEVSMLSVGTDGIDGNTDAAGALVDTTMFGTTKSVQIDKISSMSASKTQIGAELLKSASENAKATHALAEFDSNSYLESIQRVIKTGPTGNNLMDLQLILVSPIRDGI